MEIRMRLERPEDFAQTEHCIREAFWNGYQPGCVEHYLMHRLRESPAFIPELDVVALDGETVAGHVVCTRAQILCDGGGVHPVLCLGPIAVLPEYQGRGLGGALIEEVSRCAQELGWDAILLFGDPDYYSRHGFVAAEELGIRAQDDTYRAALQARVLQNAVPRGRFREDPVFDVDPEAAEAFDRRFPKKEKLADTPRQLRFRQVAAMGKRADGARLQ